ncbi:MAG: hydrogenase expression/formation protein HypE [Propionibacteriaceae bacterium]|jgi:hydrogenase expression/formation protein HypE|nr:hydrogenase expression/formation protein HypE [Propionibacteriaceae bacterium]
MDEVITLAHGAGGKASAKLIDEVFIPAFGAADPAELTDAALLTANGRLAFSTDSYVVNPIRFPGGSIGELAVNGTVNDLAVSGAQPHWLSAAFVIEEGLAISELTDLVAAMAAAAERAGVRIVTGDTKVVPRGAADKVFITTAGIGLVPQERSLGAKNVAVGDVVIGSGPIGSHGMAVMLARGNLALNAEIQTDSAPLNGLVEALYSSVQPTAVHWMRDATRGGLGTVANELAQAAKLGILLDDEQLRVDPAVRGACDLLGIDPLYVANEGFFIAVVAEPSSADAVRALRQAGATQAGVIGKVIAEPPGIVAIRNAFGGTRLVDMMIGDPLPRIC